MDTPFPTSPGAPVPVSRQPLIGREREIREIRNLLQQPEFPILTITGPGGVGKTRVARAVAASLAARFPDGVRIASLAPLYHPDRVPNAIARALGISDPGDGDPLERCAAVLSGQRVLLVLDNFEHVAAAARFVGEVAAACPALRVLVTSRTPLRVSCERTYPLHPLALPVVGDDQRETAIGRAPAVQLFIARACLARPGFALTPANATTVARICRRLDGLPLAIELAAAWLRILPVEALFDRLSQRLPLLTGGARDLPARLQTMRGAIAWSHDLLSADEQQLFRRLAVFAGGFTIAAAERVAAPNALAGIAALVDASLVVRVETPDDAAPRFTMLETIREYARERLEASGESDATHQAHAGWLIGQMAGGCLTAYAGPVEGPAWFADWDREIANVQAALDWADTNHEPDVVLRLIGGMFVYWYSGRDARGIRARLERALASRPLDPTARAQGLTALSALLHQGDGALEASRSAAREAISLWQQLGAAPLAAYAHYLLAIAHYRLGDLAAAKRSYDEAIATAEAAGATGLQGEMYSGLGQVNRDLGDLAGSLACYQRAMAIHEATHTDWGLAVACYGCGTTAYELGNHARARALYTRSLRFWHGIGDRRSMAACLEGLAWVASAKGEAARAVRLLGAADVLRERAHTPLPCRALSDYGCLVAEARTHLSEEAFRDAWLTGRALSTEAAVAEGAAMGQSRAGPLHAPARGNGGHPCGLTAREVEVLRLAAEGLANPAIAAALYISRRTVGHHIASILRKLDVPTRGGAVAAASRKGLL